METLGSYNQDQNKTQERDAATVQLDEMVSREYGLPIETARELNDKLIVDAIAVAVQMGIPQRQAPSDEQLDL